MIFSVLTKQPKKHFLIQLIVYYLTTLMNNQQVTKIISYFRINHNFHSPYSLIIDGNFLKMLVEKDLNLEEKLKSIIPGKIKLKVTKCTIQQLGILGHEFQIILQKAKQMFQLKCQHSFQTVDRCILEHIEKEESLIVCSQDKILRRKLRNKNVGIMYFGPDQRITMQDIQRHQLMNMKQIQKEKFLPAENQRQELDQYKSQQKVLEKIKKKKQQQKLASARGVQLKYIKKKIVKGPNPLSVKQKKRQYYHQNNQSTPNEPNPQQKNQQAPKKKRIRKRNKNKQIKQNNSQ